VVFHGLTEVISQGKIAPSEHTVLTTQPLQVKV
jgi:exosome complex RNA-binding protein Rrp42 (RNase PH superfamily)